MVTGSYRGGSGSEGVHDHKLTKVVYINVHVLLKL